MEGQSLEPAASSGPPAYRLTTLAILHMRPPARRPEDTGPVWVPRRPPRAQSWGGASGGGTGPGWGVSPEDPGSSEPPSGDVWVPRGRPPAAAAEVWVCWAGGSWVWREWDRPVGATAVQPDRVWTLRKGTGGN